MIKPGPGNYDNGHEFGSDAKSFSIRGRPKDVIDNNSPGPGGYDPNSEYIKETVRTTKFS